MVPQGLEAKALLEVVTEPQLEGELLPSVMGVQRDREDVSNMASDRLTALERETLALFAGGRSYNEIAQARGKSSVTIRNTLYRIQDKLGIKSKQGLVIWAVRNDLVNDVAVGRDPEPVTEES